MDETRTYSIWKHFLERNEKEAELEEQIESLRKKFEESSCYNEYQKEMKSLEESLREERINNNVGRIMRFGDGKNARKKTNCTVTKMNVEASDKVDKLISKFNNLTRGEQILFTQRLRALQWDDTPYSNPVTTTEDISDLQDILARVCISFINERKLNDIEEVSFTIDSLQASAKEGKWAIDSDAYIRVSGYEKPDKNDDDLKVRRIIGEYF